MSEETLKLYNRLGCLESYIKKMQIVITKNKAEIKDCQDYLSHLEASLLGQIRIQKGDDENPEADYVDEQGLYSDNEDS